MGTRGPDSRIAPCDETASESDSETVDFARITRVETSRQRRHSFADAPRALRPSVAAAAPCGRTGTLGKSVRDRCCTSESEPFRKLATVRLSSLQSRKKLRANGDYAVDRRRCFPHAPCDPKGGHPWRDSIRIDGSSRSRAFQGRKGADEASRLGTERIGSVRTVLMTEVGERARDPRPSPPDAWHNDDFDTAAWLNGIGSCRRPVCPDAVVGFLVYRVGAKETPFKSSISRSLIPFERVDLSANAALALCQARTSHPLSIHPFSMLAARGITASAGCHSERRSQTSAKFFPCATAPSASASSSAAAR